MPNLRYELHHKICNLRYGTHGYGMSAYTRRCRLNSVILNALRFANDKGHTSRSFIFGFCRSEHGLTDFQIEFLWSVCSKYCSFITYEIMNVKWTNIVFVLRYGDETLHLWKPLLNTNDQRGSSQCLTQRNTIFVHFTFMFS